MTNSSTWIHTNVTRLWTLQIPILKLKLTTALTPEKCLSPKWTQVVQLVSIFMMLRSLKNLSMRLKSSRHQRSNGAFILCLSLMKEVTKIQTAKPLQEKKGGYVSHITILMRTVKEKGHFLVTLKTLFCFE
nr:Biomphalaria glabrata cysteine protease ATG4D-like [Biomphalaria glabrata]